MPRVIRRTPLEDYVKDYLKSTATRRTANTNLLLKAAEYINQKIAEDCCDPNNPVIDLHTGKDSTFVHTVWTILRGMSRKGNIQSLTRSRNAIIDYVTPPCCFEDSTEFTLTGPSGTVHSAINPYLVVASAHATGPFAGSITHIDFYFDGVLRQVSIVNPAPVSYSIPNPVGTLAHSYYWVAYTESGTSVQSATTNFTLINP